MCGQPFAYDMSNFCPQGDPGRNGNNGAPGPPGPPGQSPDVSPFRSYTYRTVVETMKQLYGLYYTGNKRVQEFGLKKNNQGHCVVHSNLPSLKVWYKCTGIYSFSLHLLAPLACLHGFLWRFCLQYQADNYFPQGFNKGYGFQQSSYITAQPVSISLTWVMHCFLKLIPS